MRDSPWNKTRQRQTEWMRGPEERTRYTLENGERMARLPHSLHSSGGATSGAGAGGIGPRKERHPM